MKQFIRQAFNGQTRLVFLQNKNTSTFRANYKEEKNTKEIY